MRILWRMQEEAKKKNTAPFIAGLILVAVAVVLVAWYILNRESFFQGEASLGDNATTTVTVGGITYELPPGGKVDVEQVPIDDAGPAPDVNRAVHFPASFPTEAQTLFINKITPV